METDALVAQLHDMVGIILAMSLPPLIGAVAIGLVIGILQAVTQIQDQSLPLAFKLIVVMAILAIGGPILCVPLVRQSTALFDNFPLMAR